MGLSIFIGLLTDLREQDPDGLKFYEDQLAQVNRALEARGLPGHSEPSECEYWDAEMFGYSGLHYLRRIAAHLALIGAVPLPGSGDVSEDPVLDEYYDVATGKARGLRRLFGKPRPRRLGFDHLVLL